MFKGFISFTVIMITLLSTTVLSPLFNTSRVSAQVASSTSFQLTSDSINSGGTDFSNSTSFQLSDTVGEAGTGLVDSSAYGVNAGYRQMFIPVTTEEGGDPGAGGSSAGGAGISGGGSVAPFIHNLEIDPVSDGAVIRWQTRFPSSVIFRWGETSQFELGTIIEPERANGHEVTLTGLTPGTTYFIDIISENRAGRVETITRTFTTDSFVTDVPQNVSGLGAVVVADGIKIDWINPNDPTVEEVRVVRSEAFYPSTPEDGSVLFEGEIVGDGLSQSFVDEDAKDFGTYYYTVFTKNGAGVYSSGSVISLTVSEDGMTLDPFDGFDVVGSPDSKIQELSIINFLFFQDGKRIGTNNDLIEIDKTKPLSVVLDYDDVPEVLKTIAVTFHDTEDENKTFTFLLRVDEQKETYQATIGALEKSGLYRFTISVLDHENQGLKRLEGKVFAKNISSSASGALSSPSIAGNVALPIATVLALTFLIWAYYRNKRKKRNAFK